MGPLGSASHTPHFRVRGLSASNRNVPVNPSRTLLDLFQRTLTPPTSLSPHPTWGSPKIGDPSILNGRILIIRTPK